MNNYLCVVSYLGHSYRGWEKQPHHATIQGSIEKALSFYFNKDIVIHGAGRTDAGVNAEGQTFSFQSESPIPSVESFLYAMNRLLPSDIGIQSIEEKPLAFHARHSSCGKRYRYAFHYGTKNPFEGLTIAQMGTRKFNREAFLSCLELFRGEHDFRDFTSKEDDVDGFRRDIRHIDCNLYQNPDAENIVVTLEANGFMTYQVRIMMGAAIKVGLGSMTLDDIKKHLNPTTRSILNYKAPAEGLTLEKVYYGKD